MNYTHAMIRVGDLDAAMDFFCAKLGLVEVRRTDFPDGRFTIVFIAAPGAPDGPAIEIKHNWDGAPLPPGRTFGHFGFRVENIYDTCRRLSDGGVVINRPPRDGRMAFVRSPDGVSIELTQEGAALAPREPWISMPDVGRW